MHGMASEATLPRPAEPRAPFLAPFGNRSYRVMFPADLLTSWAFEMETLILGWYILVETQSVVWLTVFGSLQFLGTLIAPLYGVGCDRIGARNMLCLMRGLYVAQAALLAAFALSGTLTPIHVVCIAVVMGLVRPCDLVVRNTLIGGLMSPGQLMAAVSISRTTMDSARIMGALAGAGIFALLGLGAAYVMIAGFYLASLALTLCIANPARTKAEGQASPFREVWEGLGYVAATPRLLAAMVIAFLVNFCAFPLSGGLLPYVARDVYGTDQTGLGYMIATTALGCVGASILLGQLEGRLLPARWMIAFCLIWQGLTLALGLTGNLAAGLVVLAATGVAQGLCMVPMTVIQLRNAPPELRGRIAGLRTLAVYGLPLGLWISGPVIEHVGFAATTAIYGGVGFVGALVMLIAWRAHLWPADAPANR